MRVKTQLRRMRPALGTWVEIQASATHQRAATRAISAAFLAIDAVQRRFSIFQAHSELSQINQRAFAEPVALSPEANALLTLALDIAQSSDGAFDPTAGTKLCLQRAPAGQAPDLDASASWRDIEIAEHSIRFHKRLLLDLGGIAKGHAVDMAIAALRENGCSAAVVNAGGDMRCFGADLTVHLRDPKTGQVSAESIALSNQALATSGGGLSARRSGGRARTCLVGSKRIAWRQTSVSVLAEHATIADALTKVMLFGNAAIRQSHAERFDARVIFLQSAAN